MEKLVPHYFKALAREAYGGTSDSFDHLESFKSLMLLHGVSNILMYKMFPITFRKVVRF